MIGNDCISQGYKSSSLSIIPENWEVKRLGEFSTFFSGGTPKSNNALYYGGNIPFIRSGEICKDKTELFLSQEGFDNSSAKIVEEGDILYALYGANSGQCSLSKIKGAINQAILCVRPKADKYYIMSVLQLNKEHYYNSYLQGGQGNLSGKIVSNYKIALPPIGEQKKIVEVLSEWDKAIELQTKLIEKLELRKRALMQRLLTGRVRLNGFSDKWEKVRLGKYVSVKKGEMLTSEQYMMGDIPVIAGGRTFAGYHNKSNRPSRTITISASGASAGFVAFHRYPIFATDCSTISDSSNYIIEYIFYLMLYNQQRLYSLQSGGAQPHVQPNDIIKMDINYCSNINEQIAIAERLITADKEIEIARTKLLLFRNQKQGLMQQLLTGKKRIMSSQISN